MKVKFFNLFLVLIFSENKEILYYKSLKVYSCPHYPPLHYFITVLNQCTFSTYCTSSHYDNLPFFHIFHIEFYKLLFLSLSFFRTSSLHLYLHLYDPGLIIGIKVNGLLKILNGRLHYAFLFIAET